MQVQPYLFFNGRCDEAIAFYKKAIGAEVEMRMLFKDSPDQAGCPAGMSEKVMHASLKVGESMILMSDGAHTMADTFKNFSLSVTPSSVADADRIFAALSDGGQVQMPLTATFFSPRFGMLADRFGVSWMIYVAGGKP